MKSVVDLLKLGTIWRNYSFHSHPIFYENGFFERIIAITQINLYVYCLKTLPIPVTIVYFVECA